MVFLNTFFRSYSRDLPRNKGSIKPPEASEGHWRVITFYVALISVALEGHLRLPSYECNDIYSEKESEAKLQ